MVTGWWGLEGCRNGEEGQWVVEEREAPYGNTDTYDCCEWCGSCREVYGTLGGDEGCS